MPSTVKPQVLVACRGGESQAHSLRRLARYEWSTSEDVWERVDRHGSGKDWFLRDTTDGLQAYPRTPFDCPSCEKKLVHGHETLQSVLQEAADRDGLLLI